MATISKTGINEGLTSKAEHLTRIIDALDGTATTDLIATGSFTGSFTGTYAGTITSASYSDTAVSSSYAVTASYATNAGGGAIGNKILIQFSDNEQMVYGSNRFYQIGMGQLTIDSSQPGGTTPSIPFVYSHITGSVVSASFSYNGGVAADGDCNWWLYNITTNTSSSLLNAVPVFSVLTTGSIVAVDPAITVNVGDRLSMFINTPSLSATLNSTCRVSGTALIIES